VYVAGDGRLGPDTVVRAIADAKTVARAILSRHGLRPDFDRSATPVFTAEDLIAGRRGRLAGPTTGPAEAARCLRCDEVCEICTEVCPNRANVAVRVPGFADERQIVHLDGLCNECGDCATFCPHAGLPYRDKVTVFWTREDFDGSSNVGFLREGAGYLVRLPSGEVVTHRAGDTTLPDGLARILAVIEAEHEWLLEPTLAAPTEVAG
jgi:putative selenate reductase